MNDPRDSTNLQWLEAHERCWELIWETQNSKGIEWTYMCPEFGPPSYMQILPYSNQPVSNLYEICEWQNVRQIERFNKLFH